MSLEMINQLLMLIRGYEAALIRESGVNLWEAEDQDILRGRLAYINGVSDMANEMAAFLGERIKEIIEIEKEEQREYELRGLEEHRKVSQLIS